jgi:hypothetical protein
VRTDLSYSNEAQLERDFIQPVFAHKADGNKQDVDTAESR